MFSDLRHVTLFCGNLGSGKTETAINFALALKELAGQVNLVDIDIVNPYFRTRLARDYLSGKGLNIICPVGELAGADVPALPPAILGVIQNTEVNAVFDVGGDDIGATVLGRFYPYLHNDGFNLYFVVNARRPFTGTPEGILNYIAAVERASRLKVGALVNNTNLGPETSVETIIAGQDLITEAARKRGVPVAFASCLSHLAPDLEDRLDIPVLPLHLNMQPPWDKNSPREETTLFSTPPGEIF